jgi:TonB family protein
MSARFTTLAVLLSATLSCVGASPGVTLHRDAATVAYAPDPEYPLEAKQRHERGSGVFLLRVNIHSGRVTQVVIGRSCGYKSLDDAAVKGFLQWRFKPDVLVHRDIHKPQLSPPVSAGECLVLVPLTFG